MLIKTTALKNHLRNPLLPLYVLCGNDDYFLHETRAMIAWAWKQQALTSTDAESLDKQSLEPGQDIKSWQAFAAELNTLNLFADKTLYHIRYNRKSLDKKIQALLLEFAASGNHHASVIICSNQLKTKSLSAFEKHPKIGLIPVWALKANEFPHWVSQLVNKSFPDTTNSVSHLIAQHCQNNPYAVRQLIAKLKLVQTEDTPLTETTILAQLSNQCEFQVFELSDACLAGHADKVQQILTYLQSTPQELTLLLWVVSKEIRTLSQLHFLCQQNTGNMQQACQQLGIWRNKAGLYQTAIARVQTINLPELLTRCSQADRMLKSGRARQARQLIEQLALSITLGKELVLYG